MQQFITLFYRLTYSSKNCSQNENSSEVYLYRLLDVNAANILRVDTEHNSRIAILKLNVTR